MTHQFLRGFPKFPSIDADVKIFFRYYDEILHYCLGFGVYIPPPQTMSTFALYGSWFPDLPLHVKASTRGEFHTLLSTAFHDRYTNLNGHKKFGPVIKASPDGYAMLRNCMIIAGHPRFDATSLSPAIPRQAADQNLAGYCMAWQYYIYTRWLAGTFISDRFYIDRFIIGLSPAFKHSIALPLRFDILQYSLNLPLPSSYGPENIHIKLHLILRETDQPDDLINATPRTLTNAATPRIAMISGDTCSTDPLVAAVLNHTQARSCFQCGDAAHRLLDCPRFKLIMADDFARRTLLRALARTSEPSTTRVIRELELIIHQITSPTPTSSGDDSNHVDWGPTDTIPSPDISDASSPPPDSDFH